MAYNIKSKKNVYRVNVYTAKTSMPINIRTFNIEAKNEKEAEKIGKIKANKENPDKPKNYYFTAVTGMGRKE